MLRARRVFPRFSAGRAQAVHASLLAATSQPRGLVRRRDLGRLRRDLHRARGRGHERRRNERRGHLGPLLHVAGIAPALGSPEPIVQQEPGHEDTNQEQRSADSSMRRMPARS